MELEAVGQLTTELDIRMGLGYEDAKITAQGISGQAVGSRIYQVPQFTAVAAATYTRPVAADFEGFLGLDYSYTGNSLSGTTSYLGNAPVRPAYDIVNGRIGVRHDKLEWRSTARTCSTRGRISAISTRSPTAIRRK